jgi:hypothetical protein
MVIHQGNNSSKITKVFLSCIFLCGLYCCNNDKRIPNQENDNSRVDTFVDKNFNFKTTTIDLDSLKKVVLIQYSKNSKFKGVLRIDSFDVQPYFDTERNSINYGYWQFYILNPYKDSISNVFDYDYELKLINYPKIKIRYSNFIIKGEEVYGGYAFGIDSFTYNGKPIADTFGANVIGF